MSQLLLIFIALNHRPSLILFFVSRQLVRESKQRLDAQRQEYEGAIARHQVLLGLLEFLFHLIVL